MLLTPLLLPPSAAFWPQVARALLAAHRDQLSGLRVIVPAFSHAQQLKAALAQELGGTFIPPRINTLSGWLALQLPDPEAPPVASDSQRLMTLYDSLRQQAWLKKLFSARRNADLLPLAQTLLTLSDELTQALLPGLQGSADAAQQRWQAALAQLSPPARSLLSDESQLVWSVWKSQLDANDAGVARFAQMMRLAADGGADETLIWINPAPSDAMESAFLAAYGERQTVCPITLDWRRSALPALYCEAWRELEQKADDAAGAPDLAAASAIAGLDAAPHGISLMPASSLEDEAQQGAQTIINWLQAGKSTIAIVAQDRVVARRIRALLERAEVFVSDETGWKLSTTRAAAALAAWFDVIATRAETAALLDVLKSPFLCADLPNKADQLMTIELALRRANVAGGWDAVQAAVANCAFESALIARIASQAGQFAHRRSLPEWLASTRSALDALGMTPALELDPAGAQTLALLAALEQDCRALTQPFSFAEWRAFINLQLEATPFVVSGSDRRVVMLPLNGARLRSFDAVLMAGSDAAHLPSQPAETLFFANAVRRELGLATRESRQHQQLRDFTELLSANAEVVLSWQAHQDGELNPVSAWIERLQLALARGPYPLAASSVPTRRVAIDTQSLTPVIASMPTPAAPQLVPAKLSASAYNSFVACPYQFLRRACCVCLHSMTCPTCLKSATTAAGCIGS
ncbi:PD-(D/E)XK nuclease family protein [Undibacterium arcticum]|uniref:PD-(D/E)XK nuclease family protein n=1 Tax=Undibacterium arcticum TaxID=1762892 RepID=UPI003617AC25